MRPNWSMVVALSLAAHVLVAAGFFAKASLVEEERGAGAASLEIGNVFSSVASESETEPDPVEAVEPEEAKPLEAVESVQKAKPVQATPKQTTPVKTARAIATEKALSPDTKRAPTPERVKLTPFATSEPVRQETAVAEQSVVNSTVTPTPVVEQAIAKPVATPTARPEVIKAQKKPVKKKVTKKTTKKTVKKVTKRKKKKKTKKIAKRKKKSSVASNKGGRTKSKRGKKNAVAGTGGRSKKTSGKAERSNYRGKVIAKLRRNKRYPRQAKRRKMQGTTVLRLVISRSGAVQSARIVRSSGKPILDKAVMSMVKRSGRFPPFPASMRDSKLVMTLPVDFRLR